MKIKDMPISEMPRERLIKYGVSSLSNQELLAIILKTGSKDKSVLELSNYILKELTCFDMLKECGINWLTDIKGVGIAKATDVLASIELGKRVFMENEKIKYKISCSKDVFDYMNYFLKDKKQEYFYCLYLNNKNEIIERRLLFMGTVNRSVVHPREVFKYAYLSSASSVLCIHNHPSGDIKPSKEDISFTSALVEIGKIQDIPILDHIIVSNDRYYSMADNLELFL